MPHDKSAGERMGEMNDMQPSHPLVSPSLPPLHPKNQNQIIIRFGFNNKIIQYTKNGNMEYHQIQAKMGCSIKRWKNMFRSQY
jgi:hypothetical protein